MAVLSRAFDVETRKGTTDVRWDRVRHFDCFTFSQNWFFPRPTELPHLLTDEI